MRVYLMKASVGSVRGLAAHASQRVLRSSCR